MTDPETERIRAIAALLARWADTRDPIYLDAIPLYLHRPALPSRLLWAAGAGVALVLVLMGAYFFGLLWTPSCTFLE